MNWRELILRGKQVLSFPDGTSARLEWHYGRGDVPVLHLLFVDGKVLDLPDAVDVSEMLDDPRVFVLEGKRLDYVLLLGGRLIHCISSQAVIEQSFRLFRENSMAEYWTTTLIDHEDKLLIVYESGVLLIDNLFQVQFHQSKLINDVLSGIEKNRLKLVRDHDMVWYMSLVNRAVMLPGV